MDIHFRIVSSIVVLLALIGLAMLLRRVGLLSERDGEIFSKLITSVTLPALIFVSMARTELHWAELELAGFMAIATLICLALGWVVGRLLKADAPAMGAIVLCSGIGSSSLLGFALIGQVFPHDDSAMAEAVVLSSLGVQPILFTLGPIIALYYGSSDAAPEGRLRSALKYFYSPIFLSFVAGIAITLTFGVIEHPTYTSFLDGIHVLGAANTFLVTLSVGLLLRLEAVRAMLVAAAGVGVVKLIAMPVILWMQQHALDLEVWQVDVLVLEGAMPASTLAVILCSAYGCDARLGSKIVFFTTIASVITVPFIFEMMRELQ
ncbi:MAG: AEC family transporter [Hyphomicrobiaceae bacterium]|nr:AEC family transporter [Hyphomicrobiaceae bacterium]